MKIKIFIIALITISTLALNAQTKGKFGHIDSQKLLASMPERTTAQTQLQEESKGLEKELVTMQEELQAKYQDYMAKETTLTALVKQTKQTELQDMQTRIQTFQQTAQEMLEKKEAELLQPIIDKAKKAIEEVGKEKGFIYVMDSSVGVILYFSEESEDITPLVKKKLGIQ
jgi:outer membrane protein